jgi:predicted DNA-binding transcriptional regulator AlpA
MTTSALPEQLPPVLDLPTAARLLGIGRTAAYQLVKQDQWPTPVIRIGLFGSVARGTSTADSDVDLLIVWPDDLSHAPWWTTARVEQGPRVGLRRGVLLGRHQPGQAGGRVEVPEGIAAQVPVGHGAAGVRSAPEVPRARGEPAADRPISLDA